ncbi:DUF3460 family protein [Caenimonas koreensis]|uniref:DUF3460 family protein n=1 Tax=Caenimonas koreensis TaxID=367474 RepID=UPI0037836223
MSFSSLMIRIFRRPDYESDVSQFIGQLKSEQPNLEAQQRAGRALLWDKQVNREAQAEWRDARVAQTPYVYGGNGTGH